MKHTLKKLLLLYKENNIIYFLKNSIYKLKFMKLGEFFFNKKKDFT